MTATDPSLLKNLADRVPLLALHGRLVWQAVVDIGVSSFSVQ